MGEGGRFGRLGQCPKFSRFLILEASLKVPRKYIMESSVQLTLFQVIDTINNITLFKEREHKVLMTTFGVYYKLCYKTVLIPATSCFFPTTILFDQQGGTGVQSTFLTMVKLFISCLVTFHMVEWFSELER